METYYTTDEKYLQAVEELNYGETPKALKLLNMIIAEDAMFARAHHLLGKINYYDLKDYQTAGYHFKTCMELEPAFPDNYTDYLSLVVFLQMDKQVQQVATAALTTAGVDHALIYEQLGLHAEKNKNWRKALSAYQNSLTEATTKEQTDNVTESINRVKLKQRPAVVYHYLVS
ncbi:tetratricopeptide repeat protein [Mucilaginibacter litoreus]|uniref:Tetratricopeptide repeat protein n=1 Tax=Mucilaginibacter litoreus TaxID=1048221 RepID=A0ABW3AUG3_9SPHI